MLFIPHAVHSRQPQPTSRCLPPHTWSSRRATLSVSPFYRLRSSSPSTPNRSFIPGAFTSPGGSFVSTITSVSHDSFRDYRLTNGGHVTSTLNSKKSKSLQMTSKLGVGGEIGQIECETSKRKAGVPVDPRRNLRSNHFLRPPPKEPALTATHAALGSSYAKWSPAGGPPRFFSVLPVPHPRLPLAPRPDIPPAAKSSPQGNRK
jgi:hypothetical protein